MANGDGGSHGTEEDNIEDTLPVEMYTPHPEWLDSADRVCLVWGQGSDGQLGIGDCVGYTTPQVLLSMIDRPLMNVSAGHSHTVAIGELADEEGSGHGVLMSWGSNMYGQTAKELDHFSFSTGFGGPEDDDDEDEQSVPLLVPSLNGFRFNDCATGLYHTLALGVSRAVGEDSSDDERGSLDGHSREYNRQHTKVFAWGSALLGDGTSNFESRPTHIRNLDDKQIDCVFAGGHHSMAISHSTGSVYLWGWLFERDVRENEKAVLRQIPSPVQLNAFNGMSVRTVACGVWHSSVVTTEGKVFTIGLQKPSNLLSRQIDLSYSSPFYASDEVKANVDVVNELDLQDQYDEEVTPSTAQSFPLASQLSATLMSGVPAIAACACGDGFTVMLSDGGEIYFSGLNKNIGASRLEAIKVEVNSTSPVKSISAGLNFYTAVTAAGDVYVQGLLHGRVYRSLSKVITAKAITHTATGNDFCIAYTRE
ncbi:hypothetical protein, variant 1 [Sphaeroforma arctica JP610]|uniref:Uncharacterized protein n=2 Tax=Sphaeroforma arctica JP610 TaxID=667725 RepID=A0A0L0G695_9EUKA|nr:hypothetical protein, variant 1 [Sphaeroforma arctica JP610]KNC84532.1 hypothetical protein, variant 1 [Sphaeroforma arctica JP610]|eukprot:XP_014158434.1 hypothetical protein, variant 1 [Sphaeroforma arctica JP610]